MKKVLFDGIRAVTQAQNEILVAKMRVVFHHVPEDGAIADRHHGLGDFLRILPQAHSVPTTKDDYFHGVLLLRNCTPPATSMVSIPLTRKPELPEWARRPGPP